MPAPVLQSPADLLVLGLGSGGDDPALEHEVDLGAFLCACPELELQGSLGRGGMGIVFRARQVRLDRDVAVKLMSPEVAKDPEFAERFEREAKAMARLQHPGIVAVHDFGEAAGVYYLVMELVDGPNLRELMDQEIEPAQATEIVSQLCDALSYAHEQGVVHRDIKPENVLLDRSGRVRIADFGLAKLQREPARGTATRTRRVLGTPQYMAPEQIRDPGSVDHRSDIFAIGVVFYEMLTGQLPVGRFPAPSELGKGDVELDEVVLRALESSRERRFQSASEIRLALSTIAEDDTTTREITGSRRSIGWALGGAAAIAAGLLAWKLAGPEPEPKAEAALAEAGSDDGEAGVSNPTDRWPARELGMLDPSVAGVVGVDWSELRQAPALLRAGSAAFGDDTSELTTKCKTDLVDRTHKVVVGVAADAAPKDAIIHGEWDVEALEACLGAVAVAIKRGNEPRVLTWTTEPLGDRHHRITIRVEDEEGNPDKERSVAFARRGSTILLTLRDIDAAGLDELLAGETTSQPLRDTVLTTVDLRAPVWVYAQPNPDVLPMDMVSFFGTLELWENLAVDATVSFKDEAAAKSAKTLIESYANVFASLPDLEKKPEIEVEQTGDRVHAHASLAIPDLSAPPKVGETEGEELRFELNVSR